MGILKTLLLKGHIMTIAIIALSIALLISLTVNFKNQEMIEELIATNQAQARKIQELKNRISF